MPVVSETQLHQIASDLNKPSTSRGIIGDGGAKGQKFGYNSGSGRGFGSTPYRRSEVPPSPELIWQAPDTFSCLESLGVSMTTETPYTIFDINKDNGYDRVC